MTIKEFIFSFVPICVKPKRNMGQWQYVVIDQKSNILMRGYMGEAWNPCTNWDKRFVYRWWIEHKIIYILVKSEEDIE